MPDGSHAQLQCLNIHSILCLACCWKLSWKFSLNSTFIPGAVLNFYYKYIYLYLKYFNNSLNSDDFVSNP